MWLIIKEALLALVQANPETIIHLSGGYARVKVSPLTAVRLQSARTRVNGERL
jgi:hypothetical protein